MVNPMLQQLTMSRLSPMKNLLDTVRSSGNPMMTLNQMAGNNPAIRQVMDYVNANGGDARTAFYRLAQERGVDPDSILNSLK